MNRGRCRIGNGDSSSLSERAAVYSEFWEEEKRQKFWPGLWNKTIDSPPV
jgi:hypothetical protein